MEFGCVISLNVLPDFEDLCMQMKDFKPLVIFALLCVTGFSIGCGIDVSGPPAGAFLGRAGTYNYSPTAIQVGNRQQFWWCGAAQNPDFPSQTSDTIQYVEIDLSTHHMSAPVTVLAETPGSWDSVFTCNPKAIRGSFTNPLGDGQNYSYALYYVGTASRLGIINNIGVAFSNDGVHWKKYPHPVISATTDTYYGAAQPNVYNSDGKSGIWLIYEDANEPPFSQHIKTVSTDGVHFTVVGPITMNGSPQGAPSQGATIGDMAYDPSADYWYAIFNGPSRTQNPTTGNWYVSYALTVSSTEPAPLGVTLYRIKGSSLMTGATPWEMLKTFDTNLTGFETNFIAGLLRDQYGNVNIGPYPNIQLFPSISDPAPSWTSSNEDDYEASQPINWNIGKVEWVPGKPLMALNQYVNKTTHEVTTGWIDPSGGFVLESTLAHLYESPQQGANVAFYGCKAGSTDYFVSIDSTCGDQRYIGLDGYGYSQPVAGLTLVPLYSCNTGHDHFVSHDANCEAQGSAQLLGYALP
jgi:hypothetical protein